MAACPAGQHKTRNHIISQPFPKLTKPRTFQASQQSATGSCHCYCQCPYPSSESMVVVFTASNCIMGDAMTSLVSSLGVNAAVHDLDRDHRGQEMERELDSRLGAVAGRGSPAVPAVFVGGHLVGRMNRVMALHLAGELVPMLKSAGALLLTV